MLEIISWNNSTKITILTLISFLMGIILIMIPIHLIILSSLLIGILTPYLIKCQQSKKQVWKYTITTYIFGIIDGICFCNLQPFTIYLIVMMIYFYGQFQLVNCYHHVTLSWNAFLIYHSNHYVLAHSLAILEHIITRYAFNFQYKHYHILQYPAFFIMFLSAALRITAFFTAKQNFTHIISTNKKKNHILIKHGVYSFFRHPSYTGFFYFSVFSMVFIGNFACAIIFTIALISFFKGRINYQEYYLLNFFPEYNQYRLKTYILIPFVKGYQYQQ